MKTSKDKTISKSNKTSKVSKAVKSKKVTATKSVLNEEEIRKKADEIYYERIAHGESGTAIDDWHKAEKLLRGS